MVRKLIIAVEFHRYVDDSDFDVRSVVRFVYE
jgi:hypothetical protein